MRIGLDARAAEEVPAGRGRYVRELLQHLAGLPGAHTWELFARRPWEGVELDERFTWNTINLPDPAWNLVAGRSAARCDAFLSTNSYLTAWFCRCPCAVVVHDLVAFHPEYRPQARAALIEKATIGRGLQRARALIAVSAATRRDLLARFPSSEHKVEVIPHAADARFSPIPAKEDRRLLAALGVSEPFVLTTGTLEPRKNLVRLVEAFASLPESKRGSHTLVLAGPYGWEMEEILDRTRAHAGFVKALGRVSEAELAALYRNAVVFAYPSLYEGFGLPVLEAMQSGTPVITSGRSSMPEVARNAAWYVDPTSTAAIGSALLLALTDKRLRIEKSTAGLLEARRYDWTLTAQATRDLLVRIAS